MKVVILTITDWYEAKESTTGEYSPESTATFSDFITFEIQCLEDDGWKIKSVIPNDNVDKFTIVCYK